MREWAVIDRGRTIHIEDATCPADVMASALGHGFHGPIGVAYRDDRADEWVPL